jgi:hypothetical protein
MASELGASQMDCKSIGERTPIYGKAAASPRGHVGVLVRRQRINMTIQPVELAVVNLAVGGEGAAIWDILSTKEKTIEREEGMVSAACSPSLTTEKDGMVRKIFWRWS